MSEASIFGESGSKLPLHHLLPADHGGCGCPAHGLFGERTGAQPCHDRTALYGRVQSNSSASFTART